MQALILAAGCGSRLKAVTEGRPKGLVDVGGTALLDRQIATLAAAGIRRICLVTGYEHAQLEQRFGQRVEYRHNPFFQQSNNLVSFLFARDWIREGSLVLYADLLYGPDILELALAAQGDVSLLVDRSAVVPGHALVSMEGNLVRRIGRDLPGKTTDARFIGIARFSQRGLDAFLPELETAAKAGQLDQYYTVGVDALAARGYPVEAVEVDGKAWLEIDTPEDLRNARETWG